MPLGFDRIHFDPSYIAESHKVGSYLVGAGGNVITETNVGADYGLDVNIINASLAVTATDLDIRDLTHVSDSVKIGDGTDFLAIESDGKINVNVFGNAADDAADSGNPIKVGSRAVSGALTAVSASNDRADLVSDLYRRVYVKTASNISGDSNAVSVAATATQLDETPLAGRSRVYIQNLGSGDIYLGFSNAVTTSDGLRIAKGSYFSDEIGEDVELWAISSSGTNDVRFLEVA